MIIFYLGRHKNYELVSMFVSTGSVVTKDIPPNTIVSGIPAEPIGKFNECIEKRVG